MRTVIEINPAFRPYITAEDVLRITDGFDGCGELIFDGRNKLRRVDVCGADVVVKRFKPFNAIRRISRRFRRTKAERAYHNGLKLIELGVKTPEPLAYVEKHNWWGALVDSFYICRYQELQSLESVMSDPKALDAFADFAARLHSLGILHHDLNKTNVCFNPQKPYDYWVIDINRMNFRTPSLRDRRDNLQRFCKSGEIFNTFTAKYLDKAGLPDSLLPDWIAAKDRYERRRNRKKAFKRFIRGRR